MKVALYARVSTAHQGTGLEAQVRALKDFCSLNRIDNIELFTDENQSGTKSSRPALDRMMTAVMIGRKKVRNSMLIRALLKSGMTYRAASRVANCSHGSIYAEKRLILLEQEQAKKKAEEEAQQVFPDLPPTTAQVA